MSGSVTILSPVCEKCKKKGTCNIKRLALCAYHSQVSMPATQTGTLRASTELSGRIVVRVSEEAENAIKRAIDSQREAFSIKKG